MSDSDSDYNVEEYIKPETVRRTYNNEDGLSEKDESDEESGIDQDSGEEDVQDIPNGQCIVANGIRQQQRAEPNEPQKSNSRFILYVTNLAATTNRTMLEDFFGDAGAIKSIRIPKVRLGNFAFVEMFDFEGYKAGLKFNNKEVDGRKIQVYEGSKNKKHTSNKNKNLKRKNQQKHLSNIKMRKKQIVE